MLLQPSKTKYRKQHKGRIHGKATRGFWVSFGEFAIKALEPMRITAQQLEAARKVLTGTTKRQGKIWIRVFPDVPVTMKPAEVRMGKGKGSPEFWVVRIKPGTILFEMSGVPEEIALEACRKAATKLPVKTKVVRYHRCREELNVG